MEYSITYLNVLYYICFCIFGYILGKFRNYYNKFNVDHYWAYETSYKIYRIFGNYTKSNKINVNVIKIEEPKYIYTYSQFERYVDNNVNYISNNNYINSGTNEKCKYYDYDFDRVYILSDRFLISDIKKLFTHYLENQDYNEDSDDSQDSQDSHDSVDNNGKDRKNDEKDSDENIRNDGDHGNNTINGFIINDEKTTNNKNRGNRENQLKLITNDYLFGTYFKLK